MPALTEKQIQQIVNNDDRFLDSTAQETLREFDRLFRNYKARVKEALSDGVFTERERRQLIDRIQVIQDLRGLLEDAGVLQFTETYGREFEQITDQALRYFGRIGEPRSLAGASAEQLEVLIDNNVSELYETLDDRLVLPLQRGIVQGVLGDRPVSDVAAEIDGQLVGLSTAQVENLVFDSYSRFHREVREVKAAELEFEVRWYMGPDDKKTSDQCQFLLRESRHGVPGMWLVNEIHAGMHPALVENPLVVGGHYNCRHRWVPMNKEDAKEYGFRS